MRATKREERGNGRKGALGTERSGAEKSQRNATQRRRSHSPHRAAPRRASLIERTVRGSEVRAPRVTGRSAIRSAAWRGEAAHSIRRKGKEGGGQSRAHEIGRKINSRDGPTRWSCRAGIARDVIYRFFITRYDLTNANAGDWRQLA